MNSPQGQSYGPIPSFFLISSHSLWSSNNSFESISLGGSPPRICGSSIPSFLLISSSRRSSCSLSCLSMIPPFTAHRSYRPFTLTEIPALFRTPTQVNARGLLRKVHSAQQVSEAGVGAQARSGRETVGSTSLIQLSHLGRCNDGRGLIDKLPHCSKQAARNINGFR